MDEVGGPLTCSKCGFRLNVGRMNQCPQCGGPMQIPIGSNSLSMQTRSPSWSAASDEALQSTLPKPLNGIRSGDDEDSEYRTAAPIAGTLDGVELANQIEEERADAEESRWNWQLYGAILGAWMAAIPGAWLTVGLRTGDLSVAVIVGALFGGIIGPAAGIVLGLLFGLRWAVASLGESNHFLWLMKLGAVLGGVGGPAFGASLSARGTGEDMLWGTVIGTAIVALPAALLGYFMAPLLRPRSSEPDA